jgi:uncharacterized protein (DUF1697 family)
VDTVIVTTRIAFLRAVNVGHRTVKMTKLVEVAEGLGYEEAWTHINSGNLVLNAAGSRAALERALEAECERMFGFEVTTFVRTPAELRRAIDAKPFSVAPGDTHFLTLLKSRLTPARSRALEALSNDFDTVVVTGSDVHWRMRGKSTDTTIKTKDWENIVGRHRSTSRNMTMLRKLVEKIDSRS